MNELSAKKLQEVIDNWKGKRRYTYENKKVILCYKNPAAPEERILAFENSVYSFFCNEKLIPIRLVSKYFLTQTLNNNPLSENPMADKNALEKMLEEFDNEFYEKVENELNNCIDKLTTSDPLFF